ncbi:DivIVA domain-containing protein [Naumannella halotolerans]|uniref:DivIVA domain-containing protein n=1 Tax=Naumannella halotolerans TaxID=993414 RepID=UPI00370D5959
MVWMIVVAAIAVLGAGAMVAGGAFNGMRSEPETDDFVPTLPATRMTGEDLQQVRFQVQLRGYDMPSVDNLLARLAREIDQREAELAELRQKVSEPTSGDFLPVSAEDAE